MKTALSVIAGSLLFAGTALAQPTPALPDDPCGGGEVADEPPPPPPPAHLAPAVEPAMPVAAPVEPEALRPTAYSVGLGVGYRFPGELNLPNVTSARFRLASGLTFEPTVVFARTTVNRDNGTTDEDDIEDEVGISTAVRLPLRSHGRVDLDLVGVAGFDVVTTNPDGSDNTERTTVFALGYGLGLDYWVNQHWNLSFTASNPVLVSSKRSQETGTGSPEISTSNTTFGAVFDPQIMAMIHLHL